MRKFVDRVHNKPFPISMKYFLIAIIALLIPLSLSAQTAPTMETPLDTLLKQKLESLRTKDQCLRLMLPEVEKKFGADSEEKRYFWSLINEQDRINEAEVIEIIKEHGWLGVNRVGEMANQSIWLVIQHAPLETQEQYVPYLKESVALGESAGWYLAFLEDRILMRNGEDQLYGSQAKLNNETGKYHIYPIRDVKTVNERRAAIGLGTLEEHAQENGYIFDQED